MDEQEHSILYVFAFVICIHEIQTVNDESRA